MVRTSRSCQTDPLDGIQPLKRLRPTPKPSRASSSAPPLPPPPPPGIVGVWHPSMAAASGLAPAAAKYPETPAARPISPAATPVMAGYAWWAMHPSQPVGVHMVPRGERVPKTPPEPAPKSPSPEPVPSNFRRPTANYGISGGIGLLPVERPYVLRLRLICNVSCLRGALHSSRAAQCVSVPCFHIQGRRGLSHEDCR